MKYLLVCNFRPHLSGIIFPEYYLADLDETEQPKYLQKRVNTVTIDSYGLENDTYSKILQIAATLQPDYLEKKFSENQKKVLALKDLLAHKIIRKPLFAYLDRVMNQLLLLMQQQQLPVVFNLAKNQSVSQHQCHFETDSLTPQLCFRKGSENMVYQLYLWQGEQLIVPSKVGMMKLTNESAWVIWGNRLAQVAHINGNMLQPFLKDDVVIVKKNVIKDYFEKFILKVATKVNLDTEGFEVLTDRQLQCATLDITEHFMEQSFGLSLQFQYQNVRFYWYDKQLKHTKLVVDNEEVIVQLTERDLTAEQALIDTLERLGLSRETTNLFQLKEVKSELFALVHWLATHKNQLEKAGFTIKLPKIQDKVIALDTFHPQFNTQVGNDWFDIDVKVFVGAEVITFASLFPYIKRQDQFFPLANGTFFIIPTSWMHRYHALALHGKKNGNAVRLNKALFTLLDDLKEFKISTNDEVLTSEMIDYQPSVHLKATLRPYQLEGVKWLIRHYQEGFGACLADDMGLGKTLQTIAALLYVKEHSTLPTVSEAATQLNIFEQIDQQGYYLQALIILPASLVFNWEKELKAFAPHLMRLKYMGSKRKVHEKLLHRFDVVLTTYQTALKDKEILKKYQFQCIVLDESQHIKNKSSQVFKAINELKAAYKISLSGTPIENSLADLWAQMQFINPSILGSFNFFQKHFITPIEKQRDEVRTEELRKIVQPFLLRRTKQAVAKDLPALSTQVVYTDMSEEQEKIYEREKSAVRNHLLENYQSGDFAYRSLVLQSLTKLRLIANHPILSIPSFEGGSGKFSYILHQLDIIRKSGHKVLVFSTFTKHLALFERELMQQGTSYCKLTGQDSALQRDKAVEAFQNDSSVSTFLISLKAGGTGLNLTAADYVFILDPWWNPNAEDQAIARAHRIGQTRPVFATKFIAKDTIEEKILTLQDHKRQLADDILATSGRRDFRRDELIYLLE